MISKAHLRFVHVSPVKVGQAIDLIRGRDVETSLTILTQVPKGPMAMIKKLLNSAISNAKQKGFTEDQLVVSKILADKGPVWKRYRAAGFGRASRILKRTTHLTIELDLKAK
ncbi:MAG TPA: 50S ribosomal protein L22 [Candidatus Omnitrophota bacterium]|nr:50S ribosomal protein L22 [Candidatus Omnitrophota bacterium]HPD83961.1 50S ribosomal protein L22 [Candidatus Omnitrophota bacterium]HRZ02818.1 50S ribosomal protein L22 [Candidatus Omnitrophota bacterium]